MNDDQLHEFLCQALETEQGRIEIYQTAIRCARNAVRAKAARADML